MNIHGIYKNKAYYIALALIAALSATTQSLNAKLPESLTINNMTPIPVTVDYQDPNDSNFNLSIEVFAKSSKTVPNVNDLKNLMITLHQVPLIDETTSIDIPATVYSLANNSTLEEATLTISSTSDSSEKLQSVTAQLSDRAGIPQGVAQKWTYDIATQQENIEPGSGNDAKDTNIEPATLPDSTVPTDVTSHATKKSLGSRIAETWNEFMTWIKKK